MELDTFFSTGLWVASLLIGQSTTEVQRRKSESAQRKAMQTLLPSTLHPLPSMGSVGLCPIDIPVCYLSDVQDLRALPP